ncbi:hypothetical protein XELAEV_18006837mg [Xenopus laevis]|uniref:Uncharacterized protein n=1 Tax=Xenopus laevis TaxID=8355 RepID=A0A974DZI3_XENLA|nr:hypothetical protein XELAEV_18006837mg [Xenopus laevis]
MKTHNQLWSLYFSTRCADDINIYFLKDWQSQFVTKYSCLEFFCKVLENINDIKKCLGNVEYTAQMFCNSHTVNSLEKGIFHMMQHSYSGNIQIIAILFIRF